ncbi:MAG TPA: LysR substrate-binding domain-containing protein [Ideonella sp.]|uniref:LysR substrate-binding domain-containing protein n=1 Tax=Ideonella sp. TaxID=1929293 RepID=UPI002E351562|nr:LysR substrate-binding domain-containing protein [Ideonella sp.]HEX5687036.1 LysR substrate-binding domain-containing protein [Ideonella sp.]
MTFALPTLSGLIEFECAARWGSIRLAAAELHKTPSAVSQQIKQLEATLGFALFERHARHISITEQGRELAATVTKLLAELGRQVTALRQDDPAALLRISATHSFAMKWLVPRLHRFTAQYPAIDIRVEASDQVVDLSDGRCDVALRYVAATPEGDTLVYRERLVAVVSPTLLPDGAATPPKLATLLRQPLLFEGTPEPWLRVLEAGGVRSRRLDFSRSYSHGGLLVQAAVAGHGVALAPYALACEDLQQGRLVPCDSAPLPNGYGYRVVVATGQAPSTKVQAFTTWMRDEVAAMVASFPPPCTAYPARR